MGALTFDALLRSLKPEARAPDPVYYLHGDEDVLKDEALRALTARAVEPLPPERVVRWVAHRAKQVGLEMEPEAIALLVETAGPSLGALAQELDKLAAVTAGRTATREDVATLAGVRRGQTMHDLADAALERRAADAARPGGARGGEAGGGEDT